MRISVPAAPFNLNICGIPTSTDASRAMTCLFEKDIEFRHIPMPVGRGTAVLKEIGKYDTEFESRRICKYVCEKFSEKGNRELYGRNPLAKECVEEWMKMEKERFEPPSSTLVYYLALMGGSMTEEHEKLINKKLEELGEVVEIYEKRLGEKRYLGGDEFTLADLFHLPNVHYLVNTTRCAPLFASPNLSRWWNDISSRHSWQKLLQIRHEYLKRN